MVKSVIYQSWSEKLSAKRDVSLAHRECKIETMINRDDFLILPGIVEKVVHDRGRFIPDQLIIPLENPKSD
jgi:hypothetical protein